MPRRLRVQSEKAGGQTGHQDDSTGSKNCVATMQSDFCLFYSVCSTPGEI